MPGIRLKSAAGRGSVRAYNFRESLTRDAAVSGKSIVLLLAGLAPLPANCAAGSSVFIIALVGGAVAAGRSSSSVNGGGVARRVSIPVDWKRDVRSAPSIRIGTEAFIHGSNPCRRQIGTMVN